MINIRIAFTAFIAALTIAGTASAQSGTPGQASAAASTEASELAEGEIRKIDKAGKKLTIKHGPLKNLDMPGMTMVFQVTDDAMLEKVQVGDKVRFRAEKVDGKFTVTQLEAAH
ncbi:copper-binding protein [Variovorax sp. M-6]|uniref:copper-binding protein n=1 Tax=Variovorax sp. M-6 TaxID=3233041 RepID=UPI003F9A5FD3